MREITVYDLNLILQLIIFALFLMGIYYIKAEKKSLKRHRLLTGTVVALNAVSIFLVMGRSFIASLDLLTARPYQFGSIITWIHAVVGVCAEISGAAFLRGHPPNVRLKMRVTTILWLVALLFGIVFYAYYYLL